MFDGIGNMTVPRDVVWNPDVIMYETYVFALA
jgi:hypothetical protein